MVQHHLELSMSKDIILYPIICVQHSNQRHLKRCTIVVGGGVVVVVSGIWAQNAYGNQARAPIRPVCNAAANHNNNNRVYILTESSEYVLCECVGKRAHDKIWKIKEEGKKGKEVKLRQRRLYIGLSFHTFYINISTIHVRVCVPYTTYIYLHMLCMYILRPYIYYRLSFQRIAIGVVVDGSYFIFPFFFFVWKHSYVHFTCSFV